VTTTHRKQRGFSLLEILVAFSILALSLGVLMQIFSGSLRNTEVTHDQAQAVVLAQSLLAAAGVETPLTPGETSGVQTGKFRWLLRTRPLPDEVRAGGTAAVRVPPVLDLWEVTASVTWGGVSGSPERSVSLATLRIQPAVKP